MTSIGSRSSRGLQRPHGGFRWEWKRRRGGRRRERGEKGGFWLLPLMEVLEIYVFLVYHGESAAREVSVNEMGRKELAGKR